jgi:excisionase family DNA binding protein
MSALLQVKQAAGVLGVHENTLRRWEAQGYIRARRLPSGVRRFREEDVEELRAKIYGSYPPFENSEELPLVSGESID